MTGDIFLLVMRRADMQRVHPHQDNSRCCDRCGEPVGIYPSGQLVLREHPDIELVCHVCGARDVPAQVAYVLAPGAVEERRESVPNVHHD